MSHDAFIPKIKLVHPTDCTCSKVDLKEFGFCLCGSLNPPDSFRGDDVGDLFDEFLRLLADPPYNKS